MKYYMAYGSNLNVEQMRSRCPDAKPYICTLVWDYRLLFRRGYLTVEKKKNCQVPVEIWEISDRDEKNLDRYEGYPRFYRKEYLQFNHVGPHGDIRTDNALIYIMNDGFPAENPSIQYLRTVQEGYNYFDFDVNHLMTALVDTWEERQREQKN